MQEFGITIARPCHVGGQLRQPGTPLLVDSETASTLVSLGRATTSPGEWASICEAERRREQRLASAVRGYSPSTMDPLRM